MHCIYIFLKRILWSVEEMDQGQMICRVKAFKEFIDLVSCCCWLQQHCRSLVIVIATIIVTFVSLVIILLEAWLPSPVENSLQLFLCLPTSRHTWKTAYSLDRIKLALEHGDICCASFVTISAFSWYQKTSSGTFRPFVNYVYFLELCKPKHK